MKRKTVLVTGSSRGIGAAIATMLAQENYNLVIHYEKREREAREIYHQIQAQNPNVLLIRADLRSSEAVDRMFTQIEAEFGGVDILINNAGIASMKMFQDIDEATWLDIFDVNVHGSYRCARRAVPHMIRQKYGCIVGISSIWGVTGGAMEVHYSATKGAIISMNKALAKELGYSGITVNTVAPGGVDTEMLADVPKEAIAAYCSEFPAGRLARTEEIASVVKFLISDEARYITGEVLNINGGAHI